jgi:hypothetical protein
MSMVRTLGLAGAAMLAAGLAAAPQAHAQANCDTYAKLALQQQKENEALKCGFSGPEWSGDLRAHVGWCSSVGPEEWKVQLQNRTQQLAQCKASK